MSIYDANYVVWFLIYGADYVNRPALNVFLTALDQHDIMDATLVRCTLTRLLHKPGGRKQSLLHYCIYAVFQSLWIERLRSAKRTDKVFDTTTGGNNNTSIQSI